MFCPSCGSQLPDGSVFCSNCGKSLTGGSKKGSKTQARNNNAQMNYAPVNQQPNQIVLLLKECLEKVKRFLSDQKEFFESFMQGEQYSPNMPMAFIVIEVIAGVLFALSIRVAISSIIKHYMNVAMGSFGGYNSYSSYNNSEIFMFNETIKSFTGTVFGTIAIWVVVSIAVMWLVRYLLVKFLVQDNQRGQQAFACLSVVSVVEVITYIISIVFVVILSFCLKFDVNKFTSAINSGSSYDSNVLTQTMQLVTTIISQFKFLFFALVVFIVAISFILIFHVLCISKFTDTLENTDNLPRKKGLLFVAIFAIILILFDKFYFGFVLGKVVMDLIPKAALFSSLSSLF